MEHLIDKLGIKVVRKSLQRDGRAMTPRERRRIALQDSDGRQVFKETSVETDRSIQTSQDIEQAHRKNIHMLIEHIPFNKLEKLFELFAVRNGNHDNRVELYAKIEL